MSVPTVRIPVSPVEGVMFSAGLEAVPTREVKLGALPPRANKVVYPLRAFYDTFSTPTPKAVVDWFSAAVTCLKRMFLNDQYGCCVISGKGHKTGVVSGNDKDSGGSVIASDGEILSAYNRLKAGPGDSGCIITDVLDAWQGGGITFAGRTTKIDGYVSVDWTNKLEVQIALDLFGGLCIGINLPSAWANNASPNGTWGVTSTAIVGGHDVECVGYNDKGIQISTWGIIPPITITWDAFLSRRYLTECYAILMPLWYNSDKLSGGGIDVAKLKTAMDTIRNGGIPDIDPPLPPSPPIPPVPPVPPTPPTPIVPVPVTGSTTPVTIQFQVPSGVLGRYVTVSATIPSLKVTGTTVPPTASSSLGDFGGLILPLIIKYGKIALPIIITGLLQGKTWQQIIAELEVAFGF